MNEVTKRAPITHRAVIRFGKRRACHVKTLLAFDSRTGKLQAWSRRNIDAWAARHINETERPAWLKRAKEAFRNDDGTSFSRMIARPLRVRRGIS